ncbi:MAG: MoaD/ThiS family protein [Chloroflexi bacterium]|nr:MoaD/ThiS family protein [Chloroflexota bacterium]
MPKVSVIALSTVREQTGWSVKEMESDASTVADLFKLVETKDGCTLFDLLIDGDRMRRGYVVFLNGESVISPARSIQDGDKVVAIEVLRIMAGGRS